MMLLIQKFEPKTFGCKVNESLEWHTRFVDIKNNLIRSITMFNTDRIRKPIKISHPLVRSAYLKKESRANRREQDVLVLEAHSKDQNQHMEFGDFDSYLYDLVSDLEGLKEQALRQGSSIDRVDICAH